MHRCGYRQAKSFRIRAKTSYRSVILPLGLILLAGCSRPVLIGATSLAVAAMAIDRSDDRESTVPDEGPFFNRGRDFGTDAYGGPFDLLINKGYATTQWVSSGGQDFDRRMIFENPYGWQGVWNSVRHPGEAAADGGGWGQLLRNEVIPFSTSDWKSWAWASNYTGHLLEGGIATRRLTEWYEARGVPGAAVLAGITSMGASVINEAYEGGRRGVKGSTMIDLLAFDLGGVLLFQSDRVSRFFAQRAGAALWPLQASITAPDGRLINNGHHLIFKLPLRSSERVSLFVKTGLGLQVGLSFKRADGMSVSFAVGGESRAQFIDPVTKQEKVEFGLGGGLWWDFDNTLLASLLLDEATNRLLALNVYPGVWKIAGGQLGLWFTLDHDRNPYFGITGQKSLGMGLGYGF
jgi:hypothetical protein